MEASATKAPTNRPMKAAPTVSIRRRCWEPLSPPPPAAASLMDSDIFTCLVFGCVLVDMNIGIERIIEKGDASVVVVV